ncbi:hypothetical protein ABZ897_26585 [Nonomuraea sp. NPDC046802]|uniref:hypothetical protein n=1 Tax=Nonomuraea sp. NPDC046802 TaxID=3154919 RepID=UPI0033CF93D2
MAAELDADPPTVVMSRLDGTAVRGPIEGRFADNCRDSVGTVLLLEEDRVVEGPDGTWSVDQAWTVDAADLAIWWRRWLVGDRGSGRGEVWNGWRGRL